jgi:hypothetical protein
VVVVTSASEARTATTLRAAEATRRRIRRPRSATYKRKAMPKSMETVTARVRAQDRGARRVRALPCARSMRHAFISMYTTKQVPEKMLRLEREGGRGGSDPRGEGAPASRSSWA